MGFARRNFMVPIPEVDSFAELNTLLLAACLTDDQRHVSRQKVTIGEAWEMEKSYLLPLPDRDFKCCVTKPVTLNPFSQVEYETDRYSVPADKAYHNLVIRAYPFRVDVLYLNDVIASHPRCYDREQDILDPLHYLPLLEQRPGAFEHAKPIRRWRESWPPVYERLLAQLRDRWPDGRGVREFVRILKLHQDHPANLVSQAIGQALEYGCVHADGVQLCLRQLMRPEQPVSPVDLDRSQVGLERAAMQRSRQDSEPEAIGPMGRILRPTNLQDESVYRVREEEVPRSGVCVSRVVRRSRWIDGSTHLWIARRKGPGAGEGSSGLRFDIDIPTQTRNENQ